MQSDGSCVKCKDPQPTNQPNQGVNMLKYFSTISKARRFAKANCAFQELMIIFDKEVHEDGPAGHKYCVVNQEGINHLDQMNWDYDIVETWE